jgi:4,5-DOPA dioxygenase extradiol
LYQVCIIHVVSFDYFSIHLYEFIAKSHTGGLMKFQMPVLFISHGAPDILLRNDLIVDAWRRQAELISKPKCILVISAHWEADCFTLGGNRHQKTIHDFGGFAQKLYKLRYPSLSNTAFTDTLANELSRDFNIRVYHERGLDHGAWVPLLAMYPQADIPVAQLSVSPSLGTMDHYQLGQSLAHLRSQNVLIVASGVIVHNLNRLLWQQYMAKPDDWARVFMDEFQLCVNAKKIPELLSPHDLLMGSQAVPTLEHYLPFLVALGAANGDDAECFCDDWRFSNLSMHSYRFGDL